MRLSQPKRGDIVTFFSPRDGRRLIKRIVAIPGDVIEMRNREISVNGQKEIYLKLSSAPKTDAKSAPLRELLLTEHFGMESHTIQWLPATDEINNFNPIQIPQDNF